VLSGRERWEDIEDRPDRVLIEDGIVLLGQGVLPDRSQNRLGSSDAAIILLRRLYTRELAAIEGVARSPSSRHPMRLRSRGSTADQPRRKGTIP